MSGQRGFMQYHAALLQSYASRLKTDVRSMLENFQEITRLGMYDEISQLSEAAQSDLDTYEMQVRAENMVRAGESLMTLVADIKQYLILYDFASQNEILEMNALLNFKQMQEMDCKLLRLRDEAAADLYDLEEEYYMSNYKQLSPDEVDN